MFGNNPKRSALVGDGKLLYIHSIFKTLQGEGPYVGVPAIFIRLGGCNLACSFCDTEFEDFVPCELSNILQEVWDLTEDQQSAQSGRKKLPRAVNLVIITGGEPMRQPIAPLCEELIHRGFTVQIETNGTVYRALPPKVEIICSPKVINGKYFPLRSDLAQRITALKFIISANKSGYNMVVDVGQIQYAIPVFVQPMDEYDPKLNSDNMALAVQIAIEKGYRLSYQIHKALNIQ